MTINNLTTFTNNLWDWKILDGCFGNTRIRPTDIDGLVERKGKFLLIEAKSINKGIDSGQAILFDNLIKTKVFTVIIVWGNPNDPKKLLKWGKTVINTDLDGFRKVVEKWYKDVDI